MHNKWLTFFVTLLLALPIVAQERLVWDVDMNVLFNNREGGDEQTPDQTFFFTRLTAKGGVEFTTDFAAHRIMGGASWYQPVNDRLDGYKVLPALYYQFTRSNTSLAMGMVPLVRELPTYLWSDSMSYCTPHVRGVVVDWHTTRSQFRAMLDWRQLRSHTRREAFNVLVSGQWNFHRHWGVGGFAQYNHLAKRYDAPEGECVVDDGTVNPLFFYDNNDSRVRVRANAGAIIQLQRDRGDHKWHTPCGFIGTARVAWRKFEASEMLFVGKDLFPLYDRYGSELNLGDPYFRSKTYSRTDVRAHIVQNRHVDLSAVLTLHANDRTTGFWQQLSCRFFIDQNHNRKNTTLNNLCQPAF
ncbi:MAG: hypothetical protein IJ808_02485 [Muribaculaceae bacterium]|nr:hypothetical protein [Muribaculaceae bacterium]